MGEHCDWNTRAVPALVLLPVVVLVVVAPVVPVVPAAALALGLAEATAPVVAPVAPAEALGDAAAPVVVVVVAVPVPKLIEPTASWTLSGGGGTTPLRTWDASPDDVLVVVLVVAPALVDGATLAAPPALAAAEAPVAPVAPTLEVLVVDVAPVLDVLAVAAQDGLAAVVAPVVAGVEVTGLAEAATLAGADALETALDGAEAATLVLGTPLVGGPPVDGAAAPPPHAASTSEAAAMAGIRGLRDMGSSAFAPAVRRGMCGSKWESLG